MARAAPLVALLCCVTVITCAAADEPVAYYVPPPQFNAQMEIMELGFAKIFALFRNATGSFNFDESAKSISRLRLAIDASSLMAGNAANQEELAQLIGANDYPEIRITAPDAVTFTDGKADIKANLTLHGATKPVTLQAVLNHVGKSPYGGGGMFTKTVTAVGLSLAGSVNRSDFGISDDPNATQASRFGDMLTLRLEMQGIVQ